MNGLLHIMDNRPSNGGKSWRLRALAIAAVMAGKTVLIVRGDGDKDNIKLIPNPKEIEGPNALALPHRQDPAEGL